MEVNIKEEILKLNRFRQCIEKRTDDVDGRLRITKSKGNLNYYQIVGSDQRYISKSNYGLIQKLAQKSYDDKILRIIDNRIKNLKKLEMDYNNNPLHLIHKKLNEDRKKLIEPIDLSFEEKLFRWRNQNDIKKPIGETTVTHFTKNKEYVRSKSEKMIADALYDYRVPYKYEVQLKFENFSVFPDFTILNPSTQKVIYWEHCGMMDNIEYLEYFMKKINAYIFNGIFPGENLILTYESKEMPLNYEIVIKLINKYF